MLKIPLKMERDRFSNSKTTCFTRRKGSDREVIAITFTNKMIINKLRQLVTVNLNYKK